MTTSDANMTETKVVKTTADEDISEIKDLLDRGALNAITVDTSIFDEKGKRLTKGLFSQLTQFERHPAKLVFSDVVLMEMKRHLIDRLKSAKARFSPELAEAWEALGMEREQIQDLLTELRQRPSLEEICDEQFGKFIQESSAEILLAEEFVPMGELLRMYFERKPPFEESNPKKSEFPDAIALQTLEAWASKTGENLLVVSKDKDWKGFCEKSKRLHFVSDLATALELLQTPDDVVKSMLCRVFEELQYPDQNLHGTLSEFIEDLNWSENIRLEANSQFEFEEGEIEVLDVSEIVFPNEMDDIKLTELGDENITVTFNAQAQITFDAHFSFRKWDGIDREYVNMGSGRIEEQVIASFDITLILPIANGAFNDITMDADVGTIDVHLGEIEPDWMSFGGSEQE